MAAGTTPLFMGSPVRIGKVAELFRERQKIAVADRAMTQLLGRRMQLVKNVWEIKRRSDIPLVDKDQEREVLSRVGVWGISEGLDPSFVKSLWRVIIREAKRQALSGGAGVSPARRVRKNSGPGRRVPKSKRPQALRQVPRAQPQRSR